jgi:asparagine synthase (glutamine-hydrolysing)
LPDQLKIAGDHQKYLLRRWVADRQPQQEPWAKKRGFTVPIADWFETRRPRGSFLPPSHTRAIQPIVVAERLKDWLGKPFDGHGAKLLFNLLCYAIWHDTYIGLFQFPQRSWSPRKSRPSDDGRGSVGRD